MSAQVDVLAVLDRQLRDRAERANRYRKNAEKSARKSGEPQITADRMAAYTDLQLVELREARAAVAAMIAERDALLAKVEQRRCIAVTDEMVEAAQSQMSEGICAYLRKFTDSTEAIMAREYLQKMPWKEFTGMTYMLAEQALNAAALTTGESA